MRNIGKKRVNFFIYFVTLNLNPTMWFCCTSLFLRKETVLGKARVFCVEAYVKTKSVTGFGEKTQNFCQHDHIYKNPFPHKKTRYSPAICIMFNNCCEYNFNSRGYNTVVSHHISDPLLFKVG